MRLDRPNSEIIDRTPLWKGHISFGLVSVPVSLVTATERGTTPLHMIHVEGDCLGRVRIRKVCELDEKTVSEREIGRGYETPSGAIVPITNEDLDSLPLSTARTNQLVAVLPADHVEPRQIGAASYYLAADDSPAAAKPYVLIARALALRREVAIVKFAVHGDRERLGMLRPVGPALALNSLHWSDEIRSTSELPDVRADIDEDELAAALTLIDSRSDDQLADISGYLGGEGTSRRSDSLIRCQASKASATRRLVQEVFRPKHSLDSCSTGQPRTWRRHCRKAAD